MIVALISTYLEGRTAQHAVRSALAGCDRVIVCEGQAGPALETEVPPTDLGEYEPSVQAFGERRVSYSAGRWSTDAAKRTHMISLTRNFEPPVWCLHLDGDEVLINPEYLRDWVELVGWQDELEYEEWRKTAPTRDLVANNAPAPTFRIPLRLVELDGSISMSYVKLVRGDLIKSYELSIANLTNTHGVSEAAGNLHEHFSGWAQRHPKAAEGYLYWPPGPAPCDPYIVHRSLLRHPLRAGLRLHDQEAEQIRRAAKERDLS